MNMIQAYVRRGRHDLRRWLLDPRVHTALRALAYIAAGFFFSAGSLANSFLPLGAALVCACDGWSALLAALGSALGYRLFWGEAARQGLVWVVIMLALAVLLGERRISRSTPLLLPAAAALAVAASGLVYQVLLQDTAPVWIYLLRVALAGGSVWLFRSVQQARNPVLEWLSCALAVLSLAQIAPFGWLNLGVLAAGALGVIGAFPAAALAGLALDLAQITPVPMTAVLTLCYLARLVPGRRYGFFRIAPGLAGILVMSLAGRWDSRILLPLFLGGIAGGFLPGSGAVAHRRGETGAAQVRLELAAGVLAQTEQVLLEAPAVPVDESALVAKAAERACANCPYRSGCKDALRINQLPGLLLHKPLLHIEELPIICRKSGRFLAELHRSQEQLRSIRADRERQREYRSAVVQQYRFLSEYLQDLSDQLSRKSEGMAAFYDVEVQVYSNRPQGENGDRCSRFAGTQLRYYVLLCDGMGTGDGAIREGQTAAGILRRLLSAGYPAEYALRSLNSLCALRERAGAVTVDLAEIRLDSGKTVLYKWGAAPSYVVSGLGVQRVGAASPPPGLSVCDSREDSYRLTLRRGQTLFMLSDGIAEEEALRCCTENAQALSGDLAEKLLACAAFSGQDDATVITVRLQTAIPE